MSLKLGVVVGYKLVVIEWRTAILGDAEVDLAHENHSGLGMSTTIGWLVHDLADVKVVAPTLCDMGCRGVGVIRIPTQCIHEISIIGGDECNNVALRRAATNQL